MSYLKTETLKALVILSIFTVHTFAKDKDSSERLHPFKTGINTPQQNESKQIQKQLDLRNKFEANISKKDYKNASFLNSRYDAIINETIDISYMQEPAVRMFKSMDTLYLHPHHATVIMLPENVSINSALPGTAMTHLSHSSNILTIKPKKDFNVSNLIISSTYKNKKNFIQNIIIKKIQFDNKDNIFDSTYSRYIIKDNHLSLTYKYVVPNKKTDLQVLNAYMELNEISTKDLKKVFSTHGDFDGVKIGHTSYYITRDDRFGKFHYAGLKFNIGKKYYLGEKSELAKRSKYAN